MRATRGPQIMAMPRCACRELARPAAPHASSLVRERAPRHRTSRMCHLHVAPLPSFHRSCGLAGGPHMRPAPHDPRELRTMERTAPGPLRAASPRGGLSRDSHPSTSAAGYSRCGRSAAASAPRGVTLQAVSRHEARTKRLRGRVNRGGSRFEISVEMKCPWRARSRVSMLPIEERTHQRVKVDLGS